MGWLRSVGSIKLWVSFAECSLFYRALSPPNPSVDYLCSLISPKCCKQRVRPHIGYMYLIDLYLYMIHTFIILHIIYMYTKYV